MHCSVFPLFLASQLRSICLLLAVALLLLDVSIQSLPLSASLLPLSTTLIPRYPTKGRFDNALPCLAFLSVPIRPLHMSFMLKRFHHHDGFPREPRGIPWRGQLPLSGFLVPRPLLLCAIRMATHKRHSYSQSVLFSRSLFWLASPSLFKDASYCTPAVHARLRGSPQQGISNYFPLLFNDALAMYAPRTCEISRFNSTVDLFPFWFHMV